MNNNIVASKKCELCDPKILIVATKYTRSNGSIARGNKELPHDCDGGEEKFIRAHEISDKEWRERYAPDVNEWEGWNYLQH